MTALDAAILNVDMAVSAWASQSPRSVYRASIVAAWRHLLILLAPYRSITPADPISTFESAVLAAYRSGVTWPDLRDKFNRIAEVKDLPNGLELISKEKQ